MSKTQNYRDIKNFMHNELGLDKKIVNEIAERFIESNLEAIIKRRLDIVLSNSEFDYKVAKIINDKIGKTIEDKVRNSIKWGGMSINIQMLPEK